LATFYLPTAAYALGLNGEPIPSPERSRSWWRNRDTVVAIRVGWPPIVIETA
jgi:hypothetical protein